MASRVAVRTIEVKRRPSATMGKWSRSRPTRFLAFASSADLGTELERRERSVRQSAIYVRDLVNGNTSCVSCSGALGQGRARHPHLSADGAFVVFAWQADRGQHADSPRTDIALHDRIAAETTVITRGANASSARPRISGNGRYLAFESLASNLACTKRRCPVGSGDENLLPDIDVFDRSSGRFRRFSGGLDEWWVPSVGVWLDQDGTALSFSSRQPLGSNDPTTDYDLYVQTLTSPR
jgi:Tol biopolymer transport system component